MQLNLLKIDNCSDQDTQDLEEYIRQLYTYIKKQLQFKVNPTIRLVGDAENSRNPLGQTGNYEPETNTITVFITDRHTKDILRSICHELAHHNQNCNERISGHVGTGNGYAQNDEHLRALEKEAYEASILLRDWEDEMKTDNEQLYETLDNFHEKRQRLITEAVYEKLGFSTEFLKEARKSKTGGDAPAQNSQTIASVDQNQEILDKIILPGLKTIEAIASEYRMTLEPKERQNRADQFMGARIKVIFSDGIRKVIADNKGDVVAAVLPALYHGLGTVLDHFNTKPNDPSVSSTGRIQDTFLKRMQTWGPGALRIWGDIQVSVLLTAIQLAVRLMKVDPKYEKIPVVYRPEAGKVASVPDGNTSLKTFQVAYNKVKAAVGAHRQQKTGLSNTESEPDEDGVLKNLSETRRNTLNTLRLLESLTKKGK